MVRGETLLVLFVVFSIVWASASTAGSLFANQPKRAAIIAVRAEPIAQPIVPGGSLFAGRAGGSLFAPIIRPVESLPSPYMNAPLRPGAKGIMDLIARAEAGPAGYNAVVWSAKIKPGKLPTQMTLAEIYTWIDRTPGQNHAIGRYQFIPKTLRGLVRQLGLPSGTRFSPDVQDRLAMVLLEQAGLSRYRAGDLNRTGFMNNLAKIWAGLPNSSGQSHYHGFAGNKAVITWAKFEQEMSRIFPS